MKITLKEGYKSLQPFESEELNKFTVIVGKNGSGKSQFLDLLDPKNRLNLIVIENTPPILHIYYENMRKENLNNFSNEDWKNLVNQIFQNYVEYRISSDEFDLIKFIIENNLQSKAYDLINNVSHIGNDTELISNSEEYIDLIKKVNSNYGPQIYVDKVTVEVEKNVFKTIRFNKKAEQLFNFIIKLSEQLKKDIKNLTETDFLNSSIDDYLLDDNNLFNSKIENIFYNYAKRRDINRKNWFYKNEDKTDNDSISDADFIKKFIPPWDIVNGIFHVNNIDFQFKEIKKEEFRDDIIINFIFFKKSTGDEIPFADLSSGEKIIITLILRLFTTDYYKESLEFPDLILLDEPDAHLHPEMSYMFIKILKDIFVHKFGINIIITTHSPSTIALVDDDNIFQISNFNNTFLRKISKDEALKMLTSFIPTLSIDYKNHKQVFVESPTDQYYYHSIFDVLSQNRPYPFKLYFVSNDYGKGNSVQVIKTVNAIRSSENNSFYGIIDWDQENNDSDFVKVHGEGNRYSLENYVYDPIYIIILLMTIEAHNIHNELNIVNTYNQYNLGSNKELSSSAIKWFFNKFYERFSMSSSEQDNLRKVKYYNDAELEIPVWYLEFNGHDLEERLKIVFKALDRYKKEGDLQKELTKISARCFPFIHMDTVEVFDKIINP